MCITFLAVFVINSIIPFIYYQKLFSMANKYMFVIEKFGYLTKEEKESLRFELNNSGFNIENVSIVCPEDQKEYGELIEFKLIYKLYTKMPELNNGKFEYNEKETILTVVKNSFSKL